ncbi:MAG TPA: hypothetical protein VIO15_06335 [Bacteroidales bacterium]
MASVSSPIAVLQLLNENIPNVYSVYSFLTEDQGGKINLEFAYFNGPSNDLNKEWFKNVTLLKENGILTKAGEEFIKSGWHVSMVGIEVIGSSSYEATLYENNCGDGVVTTYLPMDLKDKLPKESWPQPIVSRNEIFNKRAEYSKKYKNLW